jgi:ABC-type nitrate/sulfonate/bicarbonate transport system substrate-binding protein
MFRRAAALASIALFCGTAALADPLKLRIGWAQAPSQLTPLAAELGKRHPEILPLAGKSYAFEPLFFRGSTPQIQALASGDLELASLGPSTFTLAVLNAHLDLRVVADVMQDGAPDHYSTWWAVRKDGPVQTFADMKGRRAALNALGATTDIVLREVLRHHGLADNSYTVIEANFASMFAMMENDKVDLVPVMPQFSHDFEAAGRYRPLFTHVDISGTTQVGMWCMRADVIAGNRPALVDFFTDYMRAVRWFLEPANRAEALEIAMAVTKESREALAYVFTSRDLYHAPDLMPNVPSIQKDIDDAVAMKVLPARLVVEPTYVDLTLIADAKARLDRK